MADGEGNQGLPYIGSKITLISISEIRYEGILYTINPSDATVALEKVRSFGTEGRRHGVDEVAPVEGLYDYIVFRGTEIKDLYVNQEPVPATLPNDPAIISSTASQSGFNSQGQSSPSKSAPASSDNVARQRSSSSHLPSPLPPPPPSAPPSHDQERQQGGAASQQQQQVSHHRQNHRTNSRQRNPAAAPGTGQSLLHRRVRVGGPGHPEPESVEGDFNFEEHNSEFNKVEELAKLSLKDNTSTEPNSTKQPAYNKTSFFDSISCDALDRLEGKDGRMRAAEERRLNSETFGAVGLNDNRRRYGGYRGGRGGRGGRGDGGRGRGDRGGYRGGYRGGRGRGRDRGQHYTPRPSAM